MDEIVLTIPERILLWKIRRFGCARNNKTENSKRIHVLLTWGLIKKSYNEKYPSFGNDEYENPMENAYEVDEFIDSRYLLYSRQRFWPQVREWLAILISIAALIVSFLSLYAKC